MGLPPFEYYAPDSLSEACRMLSNLDGENALLAGGTDLLVKMKSRESCPQNIISLLGIEEMGRIDFSGEDKSIGACCTLAGIAASTRVRALYPALASAAANIGSPAVRTTGTVGGNAVTASPAADLPPALIAYGAKVRLQREGQQRVLPLEQFFLSPGATQISKTEVLVDFILEVPGEGASAEFFKLGHRRALQCSIVNGACYIALNSHDGTIADARLVLGAVGPTVVRAVSAEKILIGEKPGSKLFLEAGNAAARDCRPLNDLRGSAGYRHDMIRVLTSRTLHRALGKKTHGELV